MDAANPGCFRLFTTLVDTTEASATELAAAYVQRWEIELAFDELKTHQRGPRTVLRSKSPNLVLQEIWGYLCCHYAIRTMMWEAAAEARASTPTGSASLPPCASPVAPSPATRDFPPQSTTESRLATCHPAPPRNASTPPRRRARQPRLIKRKMPKWHVKRVRHRHWPQPTAPPTITIHPP